LSCQRLGIKMSKLKFEKKKQREGNRGGGPSKNSYPKYRPEFHVNYGLKGGSFVNGGMPEHEKETKEDKIRHWEEKNEEMADLMDNCADWQGEGPTHPREIYWGVDNRRISPKKVENQLPGKPKLMPHLMKKEMEG